MPVRRVLRSQIVTLKRGKNIKYRPYAFTEQGVAMLSSVVNSERAVQVNIEIMRAFVRLRQMLASNAELARKLGEMEKKYRLRCANVFHAGDGNLHPLILFDANDPDQFLRTEAFAGEKVPRGAGDGFGAARTGAGFHDLARRGNRRCGLR